MYLEFYGLKEQPFNTTPDPRYLFPTAGHQEALAQLVYGVQERKGFIVLTADVGTGKTTLLQTLLSRLDSATAVAYVFNSTLVFDEMLEYILEDFGVTKVGETRAQRLVALNNFLIERRRTGQNTVLIIDEAQNLAAPTLEQVRLLSNFETPTEKLLQIVLVGQTELKTKLLLPELRQLRQRIGLRCSIPALSPQETRDYIRFRLRAAGARHAGLFSEGAVTRIIEYSEGIPRVVNILCDHCLLSGFAEQKRQIDRDIVDEAIEYLEEGARPRRRTLGVAKKRFMTPDRWALSAWAAAMVVLGGGVVLGVQSGAIRYASTAVGTSVLNIARMAKELVIP
jgi:general secretion pathway protein A